MSTYAKRSPPPNPPAYRRFDPTTLTLLVACPGIIFTALLLSGVTIGDVLLFIGFQIVFAFLPGLLSYLLLIGRPQLLLDTFAVAIALGLSIQIGCFVATTAVGERWLFSIYPIVFSIATIPLIHSRRARLSPMWFTKTPKNVNRSSALILLLITVGAVFVVYLGLFAASPLPRSVHSVSYAHDLIFNVSLAAELMHHWPFMNPSVSGVALHYHIFVNIDVAGAAQITRLEVATIVMRLEPMLLISLIGVQLFTLGRKVGGAAAAGFIALILGLGAGELNFSWSELTGGGIPALGFLLSPSYQLGAVFFLAVSFLLIDRLTVQTDNPRASYGLTLGILSFGAVGAKSSAVPILASGLALFIAGQIPLNSVRVKRIKADSIYSLVVVTAIGAAGYMFIYRGGGEGLAFKPLNFLSYTGLASVYHRVDQSPVYILATGVAGIIVLCLLSLSLLGALFVRDRWLRLSGAPSPERLLLCMFVASLLPFVLIAVPGDSQVYFFVYGFLAASVVSAAGLTTVVRTLRLTPIDFIRPGLVCAVGVLAVVADLWINRSTVALVPAYLFLACTIVASAWLLCRRVTPTTASTRRTLVTLGAIVLVCLTVASEFFEQTRATVQHWLHKTQTFEASSVGAHRGITTDLLRGLLWLRNNTPPSTVLVVNNHERHSSESAYVYYSAFSERRVFLESWQYTPQGASYVSLRKTSSPFPRLLAINDAAVLHASAAAISLLHARYGVGYIVIDRLHGPASPDLALVTQLVYSNPDITVFKVR